MHVLHHHRLEGKCPRRKLFLQSQNLKVKFPAGHMGNESSLVHIKQILSCLSSCEHHYDWRLEGEAFIPENIIPDQNNKGGRLSPNSSGKYKSISQKARSCVQ